MGLNPKSRVRVESDGTPHGTRVLVDGTPLNTVTKVSWSLDVNEHLAACTVELVGVDVDLASDEANVTGRRRDELAEQGFKRVDLGGGR